MVCIVDFVSVAKVGSHSDRLRFKMATNRP